MDHYDSVFAHLSPSIVQERQVSDERITEELSRLLHLSPSLLRPQNNIMVATVDSNGVGDNENLGDVTAETHENDRTLISEQTKTRPELTEVVASSAEHSSVVSLAMDPEKSGSTSLGVGADKRKGTTGAPEHSEVGDVASSFLSADNVSIEFIEKSFGGSILSPIPRSSEMDKDIDGDIKRINLVGVSQSLYQDNSIVFEETADVAKSSLREEQLRVVRENESHGEESRMSQTEEEEDTDLGSDPNDSMASTSSLREEEIMKTKKELGATSHAFIERLRGAAFRRKMNLARSRDSLAAKERQQREAIAAAKATRQSLPGQTPTISNRRMSLPAQTVSSRTFKARPLPETTGWKGHGGMSGVPKVDKKMTTTPFSPLLGARRRLRQMTQKFNSTSESRASITTEFQARPLPRSTAFGNVGQSGVPKVPKRPVTVPQSPLLGPRRVAKQPHQQNDPAGAAPLAETRSLESTVHSLPSAASMLSSSSQGLLGLDVLTCDSTKGKENDVVRTPTLTASGKYVGYQPHSTIRAKKRASFEAQKVEREQERLIEARQGRQQQVRVLRRELAVLRESL